MARVLILILVVAFLSESTLGTLNCSDFDPTKIKIITFDVFAALMDLSASFESTIPPVTPMLSSSQQMALGNKMMNHYGSYMNHVFTKQETKQQEPFVFVVRSSLADILTEMGLTSKIPINGDVFNKIIDLWSQLTPWEDTARVLRLLSMYYELSPLSNGDYGTLSRAMEVFRPVVMSHIFSSDWPIGAFKPRSVIYDQVWETTGYQMHEILHVAGAGMDARGARDAGLFSALLHGQPDPGTKPCFVLPSISYLPKVLNLQ
jgi:2-haloalkanoic acid dehalogenase type II